FFQISGSDYQDKIRPFKKILTKELKNDLKNFYIANRNPTHSMMLPPRMFGITNNESNIIGWKHFCRIASWIDRRDDSHRYQPSEMPYTFKLLLSGLRDGLKDPSEFHKRCDNKGYNNLEWHSRKEWMATRDSFIFSMDNRNKVINCILSRVKRSNRAIWGAQRNPCFSFDLQWFKGKCLQSSYEAKITDKEDFNIIDYEVFQVITNID
ncbi:3667_t:CDS:2, partial [Entrophospora sp. SA101]